MADLSLLDPSMKSAGRATRVRWGVMAFLCVLSFLTYYDRQCISRAQERVQGELKLSDTELGLAFGSFWLAYALFEIPGGWLCDRFGARKTLTRIVLAWSLFTGMTGAASGFATLYLYRFLFGMGEAGAYPTMARVQGGWLSPAARARAGGLLWLTARWGAAFAPLIFGAILRLFDSAGTRSALNSIGMGGVSSWRLGFIVSGVMGIIWVLAFWPFFRDEPAQHPRVNDAELDVISAGRAPASGSGSDHSLKALLQVFKSPSLWAIAGLYLCASFGWSFFMSWMPRFLRDVHKVSIENSEWQSALPLLFGGLACLLGGFGADFIVRKTGRKRLGRAILPVFGYVTAAAAMVAIRFVHSADQATILLCVTAFMFDLGQGANWASIVDIGGRHAGVATGFINMVGNMSHFIQPVIGAMVFNSLGWNALFLVYAAAFCGAASMWLFIDPTKRFYREEQQPPTQGFEVVMKR